METDVLIIGGGYYGHTTAIEIRAARPDLAVIVAEKEGQPFTRASSTNQSQLHAGYMYSKYLDLARECAGGAEEFTQAYPEAVNQDVRTFYGVHQSSEISASAYEASVKRSVFRSQQSTARLQSFLEGLLSEYTRPPKRPLITAGSSNSCRRSLLNPAPNLLHRSRQLTLRTRSPD